MLVSADLSLLVLVTPAIDRGGRFTTELEDFEDFCVSNMFNLDLFSPAIFQRYMVENYSYFL